MRKRSAFHFVTVREVLDGIGLSRTGRRAGIDLVRHLRGVQLWMVAQSLDDSSDERRLQGAGATNFSGVLLWMGVLSLDDSSED